MEELQSVLISRIPAIKELHSTVIEIVQNKIIQTKLNDDSSKAEILNRLEFLENVYPTLEHLEFMSAERKQNKLSQITNKISSFTTEIQKLNKFQDVNTPIIIKRT